MGVNITKSHIRKYTAMNPTPNLAQQGDTPVLEFKNGMTIESAREKKLTLKQHRRMVKTSKNNHERFSFDQTLTSINDSKLNDSKSRDNLFTPIYGKK